MGIPLEQMQVWDPDEPMGGLTPEQIRDARILLWKGHCSVHQMFQPPATSSNSATSTRTAFVISHPECKIRSVQAFGSRGIDRNYHQDHRGGRPANTRWLVGTELNLVNRIAEEFKPQGKHIQFMSPVVCMCSTMARIDPAAPRLGRWKNLVQGRGCQPDQGPATRCATGPRRTGNACSRCPEGDGYWRRPVLVAPERRPR